LVIIHFGTTNQVYSARMIQGSQRFGFQIVIGPPFFLVSSHEPKLLGWAQSCLFGV
jgi:hypothetical protein